MRVSIEVKLQNKIDNYENDSFGSENIKTEAQ